MIQKIGLLLSISTFLFLACSEKKSTVAIEQKQSQFLLGGIQISEPNNRNWICAIKETGMNTISVTDYVRQGYWESPWTYCKGGFSHWDEAAQTCKEDTISPFLLQEIQLAKEGGLNVVFIPRVALDHYFDSNQFLWHGMIMPKTDSMIVQWFEYYGYFVEKWAKICEEYEVDIMAVGSELRMLSGTLPITNLPTLEAYYLNPTQQRNYIKERVVFEKELESKHLWVRGTDDYQNLEKYLEDEVVAKVKWAKQVAFQDDAYPIRRINQRRELLLKEWKKLIAKVRKVYSGKLTYAANFDNYQNVGFWDELDFIGINAYFGLRSPKVETTLENMYPSLKKSWSSIFSDIKQFQKAQKIEDKKVIFTELGYIYKKDCTLMPWKGEGFSIVNKGFQKDLYIWKEQPENVEERALAVKALKAVHQEMTNSPLQGILYWKLTTKDYHIPHEPFGLHIRWWKPDPLQAALVSFLPKRRKGFWDYGKPCR